jgi:hypothetical protein
MRRHNDEIGSALYREIDNFLGPVTVNHGVIDA